MTERPRRGRSSPIVKVVVCLAQLLPALGFCELTRVSVPIPVEIEGRRVHCQIYLKLEMKNYDLPFDKFATGSLDKPETMFATAVRAIRKEDATKFASVWASPDEMNGKNDVTVKMEGESSVSNWIKVARNNFDFDHLTMVAEALLGPDTMFIFDSVTKAGVKRYALYVGLDQKGSLRLSAVSSATPLELMVLNAFVEARTVPDEYKPVPNLYLRYQYPIPLTGDNKTGPHPHPVFLEFDGVPTDFSLSDEKAKPPSPVVALLRDAHLAYKSGNNDAYANDFSPNSQARVKTWLDAMDKQRQERLKQEKIQQEKLEQQKLEQKKLNPAQTSAPPAAAPVSKPKTAEIPPPPPTAHVKFVLNADPIYLVFQAPGPGDKWMPANLTYSYILHQGNDYKIANFAFSTTLDDFLQNPALFDKNVLKPPPAKSATPNAKGVPASAKPTTVNKK
ncbi:MAG TPA: hypothetical protein VNY51_04015 [Candidatus Dormibacteraeota bacterium]|jgi:hypothetical protein|nr:hypothetical protein [Candidatus Dormibacteraeota bacterium]